MLSGHHRGASSTTDGSNFGGPKNLGAERHTHLERPLGDFASSQPPFGPGQIFLVLFGLSLFGLSLYGIFLVVLFLFFFFFFAFGHSLFRFSFFFRFSSGRLIKAT